MRRIYRRLCAAVLVFCMAFAAPAKAENVTDEIRIGLESAYKGAYSMPIANTRLSAGCEYEGEYISEAEFNSASGFVAKTTDEYFAVIHTDLSFREAMAKAAEYKTQGYKAAPALNGVESWSVYIGGYARQDEADNISLELGAQPIQTGEFKTALETAQGETLMVFDGIYPQFADGDGGFITLGNGASYRGRIEFGRYGGAAATAVNVLDIEEYLYSVTSTEMPASFGAEALKAQSVAARTYAQKWRGKHNESGYDLCDGAHCQAYGGTKTETQNVTDAVKATKGVVMRYDGRLIDAVFCASSGGATDSSENVWSEALPYLRGVAEIKEINAPQWEYTLKASQIEQALNAKGNGVGTLSDVIIYEVSANGRVYSLKFVGDKGETVVEKESVKSVFSPIGVYLPTRMFNINSKGSAKLSAASNASSFVGETIKRASRVFKVTSDNVVVVDDNAIIRSVNLGAQLRKNEQNQNENKPENDAQNESVTGENKVVNISTKGNDDNFIFKGAGNGHGVGMSQRGAAGMAEMGYTYQQILKHYYQGVTIG